MTDTARITVTAGPDKGRVYELTTEIVRLGRATSNEVALTDSQVGDLHASIVCREGRFAIHTSVPDGLEVDGTLVPPERWVWLPDAATIRIGARTSVEFVTVTATTAPPQAERQAVGSTTVTSGTVRPTGTTTATGSAVLPREKAASAKGKRTTETPTPGSDTQSRSRRSGTERGDRNKRSVVAKFITDGPGDPLVKLGEDGHLPELTLHESQSGARPDAGPKQSNPTTLLLVLGVSIGLTLLMLFMDVGSFGGSAEAKSRARKEIQEYYGKENEPLKPYQEVLREACRANSRHDYEGERRAYRDVLSQLRSEAKDKISRYTGLTGRIDYNAESDDDKKSDKRLEELIGILLSE